MTSRYISRSRGVGFAAVFTAGLALLLFTASQAKAAPDDPFIPELTFSTSTGKAGASPDPTFEMHKQIRTGCNPPGFGTNPPYYDALCDTDAREGSQNFFYVDQDLKKMTVKLPPGLVADANAAPYCDAYEDWYGEGNTQWLWWSCANQDAMVGWVNMDVHFCSQYYESSYNPDVNCFIDWDRPGTVYNEEPEAGEQGHLVVLWPDYRGWLTSLLSEYPPGTPEHEEILEMLENLGNQPAYIKSDISITVGSDLTVTAVADNIPDVIPLISRPTGGGEVDNDSAPGQIANLEMTLFGATGEDTGHPLLANPTFCDAQTIDVEFQGYEFNSIDGWIGSQGVTPSPGYGDGKVVVPDPASYQATDCDSVPYAPTFTATSDTSAPGAAPALTTTITQAPGEATTKKVQVDFPKGTGVNIASTLTPCPADALAAQSCPAESRMGSVVAESRLLPEDGGPMVGDVYLTGNEGDKITLSMFLNTASNFLNTDLRIDGTASVNATEATITATFDDLPKVPISSFTLSLDGGSKSLLKNPRKCETHFATTTLTSHSGKTQTVSTPMDVTGCAGPTFEVELSETRAGKATTVDLDVGSGDKAIKKVSFGLPQHLRVTGKGLGKKPNFGQISLTTTAGTDEHKLGLGKRIKAKGKKKKRKKKGGSALRFNAGTSLSNFRASLFTRKVISKKKKVRVRGKLRAKASNKRLLAFKNLPTDNLTRVNVELNPDETRFIRNPRQTKRPLRALRFLAFVTMEDGTKHVLKDEVKLKRKKAKRKEKK